MYEQKEENTERRELNTPENSMQKDDLPWGESEEDINELDSSSICSKLSKKTVKSIIYNVVKDADVQKMLANSLSQDGTKLLPATYEPKMTRAKMRQILSEEKNLILKSSAHKQVKNFTELEFPEDENDDDYDYESDVEEEDLADVLELYSDDDDIESNMSMCASDLGSPSCNVSPQVNRRSPLVLPVIPAKHQNMPQTIDSSSTITPMRTTQESQRRFLDALDKLDLSNTIAKRTRSQLPMNDTSLGNLEAGLVPPDITVDMYEDPELEDVNEDWQEFLNSLTAGDLPCDDEDDFEADPEYNVLAEPEQEAEDDHVLPSKVTKKEIHELMEELYENDSQDNDDNSQDESQSIFNKPRPMPVNQPLTVRKLIELSAAPSESSKPSLSTPRAVVEEPPNLCPLTLTANEQRQLTRQMQCFVQILAQQAFLSHRPAHHLHVQSVHFLKEISAFATASVAGKESMFNVCNLGHALNLASTEQTTDESGPDSLSLKQKTTLASSPACMYPELLPSCSFKKQYGRPRAKFNPSEDVLICLGLHEFSSKKNKCELISNYLLPGISKHSIDMHIKNESKKSKQNKSIIGLYKAKGVIPKLIEMGRNTKLAQQMLPPADRLHEPFYPDWLKNVVQSELIIVASNAPSQSISAAEVIDAANAANALEVSNASETAKPSQAFNDRLDTTSNVVKEVESNCTPACTTPVDALASHSAGSCLVNLTGKNSEYSSTAPGNSREDHSSTPTDGLVTLASGGAIFSVEETSSQAIDILSEISGIFTRENKALESSDSPHDNNLTTPTKRVSTDPMSPVASGKFRKIQASPFKTPEKAYHSIDSDWKMRRHNKKGSGWRTKVHSLFPKPFNSAAYNQSPTKMAAKAISEKALNRASKKTSYQSPLKRKPLEAGNPLEVSSSETKTSVAPLSKRPKKLRDEDDEFFSTLNEESGATKTKSSRRERYIACLAPDIVECDPQRAGREDLFSKWYINKVKEKLGDSSAEYEAFLQALMTFGKEKKNPAVFYEELRSTILKGHDELLDGFSAFLLPAQALACGVKCYKSCLQFHQARKFLRKLEVYFGGATKTFQKLIKLLSSGSSQNAASVTISDIRDSITAILKGHPALLKDFTSFFPDATPAKRCEEDYEEMDLTEYDEDTVIDMFEEMEVPEVDVTIATPDCKCTCHSDEKKPKAYKLCTMHCVNCRVTVLQNRLHIHAGPRKGLRPAYYRYLDPLPSQLKKEGDDDTEDCHSSPNNEAITLGTDTKELTPPLSLPSQPVIAPWTRAEDEILLKTLKTEAMECSESFALNDTTVTQLASQLQNRATNEIKQRLETLLQLLSQDVDEETSHSGL